MNRIQTHIQVLDSELPLGGILRAERNFSLSFLISSTREITRQRKIPLRAQNSRAQWKTGFKPTFIQPQNINELTTLFNNTDSDPFILPNGSKLNCQVLYADDLTILSRSRFGQQKCLNELQNWCSKWLMEVNLKETKVMIFQKGNKKMTKPSFTLDNKTVEIVQELILLPRN
jgi:hypothetical protein